MTRTLGIKLLNCRYPDLAITNLCRSLCIKNYPGNFTCFNKWSFQDTQTYLNAFEFQNTVPPKTFNGVSSFSDLKDPCVEKKCHFGAQCQPSLDGRTAECICPEKCATYGDSRSRPVCGTDGKDYLNVCELRRSSCLEMREIEVRYKGHCGMLYSDYA